MEICEYTQRIAGIINAPTKKMVAEKGSIASAISAMKVAEYKTSVTFILP